LTTIVTGGAGNLARVLREMFPDFVYFSRSEMDVTKADNVARSFSKYKPTTCIHLAANTDVAGCEKDHQMAYAVNTLGCRHVADACLQNSTYLVYSSTDYVFDGEQGLYSEEDPPNPINYYGLSKLLGEFEVRRVPKHLIVRGTMKQDESWKHPKVPDDMYQSLLLYSQFAKILASLIQHQVTGLVNVGYERYNLFEFAKRRRPDIEPIKRADITSVRLPRDCSLDVTKLRSIIDLDSILGLTDTQS
jgi:dTDP-4-dehydrorhamnose reductase